MLYLASASPRRRDLLQGAGIAFLAVPVDIVEEEPERGDPHEVALANARRKAEASPREPALAADTVVALGDLLFGKPEGDAGARAMLRRLSGTTHRVVTGVALRHAGRIECESVETRVTMRALTEAEIDAYVATGEPLGKAGAYAIQQQGDRFVTRLDGPWDNVVGLPMEAVRRLLRRAGVD